MEIPVGGISKKRHDAPLPGQRAPCHSGKVPLKDDQKGWRWNSWILCNTLTSNRYRKKPRNCRSCSLKKTLIIIIHIYINLYCFNVLKGKFECLVNQDSLSCVAKPLFPEWACQWSPRHRVLQSLQWINKEFGHVTSGCFLKFGELPKIIQNSSLYLKRSKIFVFYIAYMVISTFLFGEFLNFSPILIPLGT